MPDIQKYRASFSQQTDIIVVNYGTKLVARAIIRRCDYLLAQLSHAAARIGRSLSRSQKRNSRIFLEIFRSRSRHQLPAFRAYGRPSFDSCLPERQLLAFCRSSIDSTVFPSSSIRQFRPTVDLHRLQGSSFQSSSCSAAALPARGHQNQLSR